MLINEVSHATGLTIPTIRYYEREGLLDERHVMRQSNDYRIYTEDTVKRLRHFRQARIAGLTIAEIKQLAEAYDAGKLTNEQRQIFLCDKIDNLSQKIVALQEMRTGFEIELANIQQ